MLWSVLKILIFVVIVAALALGAGFVMENGPSVLLRVGSIEFAPSPLVAIAVITGVAMVADVDMPTVGDMGELPDALPFAARAQFTLQLRSQAGGRAGSGRSLRKTRTTAFGH